MKRSLWLGLCLAFWGCEEDAGVLPGSGTGDTVWVTCEPNPEVSYTFGCGTYDGVDSCNPPLGICLPESSSELSGPIRFCHDTEGVELDEKLQLDMEAKCASECPDAVRDQACEMGRWAENIDGCEEMTAEVEVIDCALGETEEQELELTYTPLVGAPLHGAGTLTYTLDAPGRSGRTGTLWSMNLATPLSLTVGVRDASTLLGYPEGTVVEVRSLELVAPVPLSIDSGDVATLREGTVKVTANVVISEPGASPRTMSTSAAVPLTLSVVVTDKELTISDVSGPLGGTFSFASGAR